MLGLSAASAQSEAIGAARFASSPLVASGQLLNRDILQPFYLGRDYALAWDEAADGLGPRAATVLSVLSAAQDEGLDPEDYHVSAIRALANASSDSDRFDCDLLISDGLVQYARDVTGHRLGPSDTDELPANQPAFDLAAYLSEAAGLDAAGLAASLSALPPANPDYAAAKAALAALRPFVASGGWMPLPPGGAIHPGDRDPAVPALRQRLAAENRLDPTARPPKAADATLYGPDLVAAIRVFQQQHAIKPDGVIGKDTRAALDVSAEERLRQLSVNLERLRWRAAPAVGRMVEVNLAGYGLTLFENGMPILKMPVVVGARNNQTPILAGRITTVILNPDWTLPPNVLKEIRPHLRANDSYLADRGIVRESIDGRVRFVQPPGPTNPLGRYKFVIPNDQDIYLHDTPDANKFKYFLRAYSHGCVRLGNAPELAARLLEDRLSSLPGSLDDLVREGSKRPIPLSHPVPVSLVYRTVWLDADGNLVLGDDIYGRDAGLWSALRSARGAGALPPRAAPPTKG